MHRVKATAQLTKGCTGVVVAGVACEGAVAPASVMHVCRLSALMQRPGCEPKSLIASQRRLVDKKKRKEVVDVDAMSSDACPVRMLSEGEYVVHTSS